MVLKIKCEEVSSRQTATHTHKKFQINKLNKDLYYDSLCGCDGVLNSGCKKRYIYG